MSQVIDILVVDDEPRNLDALEVILADPGYRLIRASGGDEALRLLLKHDVAAMVLDIQMPGLSGFELAQLVKGSRRFREIPIVFLTAHMMDDQDVIAGYGAGAVDYLTKPVKPEILRHKVAVFADLFRKTRALAELNETLETRVRERTAELERSESALRAAALQKDQFLAILAPRAAQPARAATHGARSAADRADPPLAPFERSLSVMNRQLAHMVRLNRRLARRRSHQRRSLGAQERAHRFGEGDPSRHRYDQAILRTTAADDLVRGRCGVVQLCGSERA